jgi:cell division control protein 6
MKKDLVKDALLGSSVFKDEASLFPEYIPPELPNRDEEIKRLARNFRALLRRDGAFSVNVAIVGNAGIGKTALVKYTLAQLKELAINENINIDYAYYNCHSFRSKTAILRSLMADRFMIQSRGFSDEEVLEMLFKRLQKENQHLILVLDEANTLESEDILSIIHANEALGISLSTVVISRPTEWKMLLDAPLSGHIHDQINLRSYNIDQLMTILSYRARIAFNPQAYTTDIIELVAEISSHTRNARHGLEILYRSGKAADNQSKSILDPEDIRRSKNEVYPELRPDIFYDLRENELITALSIARDLMDTGSTATTINRSYEHYEMACEEFGINKRKLITYRGFVDSLVNVGIVGKTTTLASKGKRGRRSKITLFDIPASVLAERVEQRIKTVLG